MKRMVQMLMACSLALGAAPVLANLIVNGSFETPVVPNGSFTNFPGGSTAITGWTVVGVDSSVVDGDFTQSGITFQAQDGEQWIDMAGVTSNSSSSGVTRSVPTTIGGLYELSFYVGSAQASPFFAAATVDLSINGGPRVPFHNPIAPSNMLNWQQFIVPFVATSNPTNLTFYNGSASNNFLSALDNVVIEGIPEPSTGVLALVTFVASALMIRKKRRPCSFRCFELT
jgi:hypothetical protein